MSGGVFAISRGVFEHPCFAPEPFTEREAWIWLIGEAAWRDKRIRVGKSIIQLKRGECAFSMRFMAGKWRWSESRVRRFLKRLKIDAMIDARSDAHATHITICKYNEYQRVSLPSDALGDAQSDAPATHKRRKEEDMEYTEDKEEPLRGRDASGGDVRKRLYDEGRRVLQARAGLPEARARTLIGKWVRDAGDDAATVLAKIRQAEADAIIDIVPWVAKAIQPRDSARLEPDPYRYVDTAPPTPEEVLRWKEQGLS
jgi:hypothetical protein